MLLPETSIECHGCGRAVSTPVFTVLGREFPGERFCGPCIEARDAEERQRVGEVILGQTGIPKLYRECSFESFECELGNRTAHRVAMDFSMNFLKGISQRPGVLFRGPSGSGKTHLAVAILRHLALTDSVRSLFINVPEWLNQLRGAMHGADGQRPPSPRGQSLVVIDDLGAENPTDWTRDQLYSIINYREANGLATLVTTNLSGGDLDRSLGRPTASRLTRLCRTVEIDVSDDFRARWSPDENPAAP